MYMVKAATDDGQQQGGAAAQIRDSVGRRIGGPPRLFVGKTAITRSGQMTEFGNDILDKERARLSKALGFDKDLSIGDVVELFLHYVGANVIDAEQAREIAERINRKTAKASAA